MQGVRYVQQQQCVPCMCTYAVHGQSRHARTQSRRRAHSTQSPGHVKPRLACRRLLQRTEKGKRPDATHRRGEKLLILRATAYLVVARVCSTYVIVHCTHACVRPEFQPSKQQQCCSSLLGSRNGDPWMAMARAGPPRRFGQRARVGWGGVREQTAGRHYLCMMRYHRCRSGRSCKVAS